MIDLNESTPYVECKLGTKVYHIYANDKNIKQIEKLVAFYREQMQQIDELDKRDEKAQAGDKDVKPIDKEEFIEISNKLIEDTRQAIFDVYDNLFDEAGIGSHIWSLKHESTEYLMFTLGDIQKQLRAEQNKYEHNKREALKKAYPIHHARPKYKQRHNYKK